MLEQVTSLMPGAEYHGWEVSIGEDEYLEPGTLLPRADRARSPRSAYAPGLFDSVAEYDPAVHACRFCPRRHRVERSRLAFQIHRFCARHRQRRSEDACGSTGIAIRHAYQAAIR
jgi:hypothetical protein